MSSIKRNIIFTLENRKKEGILITENVPIRMRVIYANNRVDFSTGFRIDTAKWDNDRERIKNGCTNKLKQSASDINSRLSEFYTHIQNIFKTFETKNTIPTPKELKEEFKNAIALENPNESDTNKINLIDAIDEFIKEIGRQNNWTEATFQKFETMKRHLTAFKSNLDFDYLNESGLNDYIIFLRDEKEMRNSTIEKQLGFLKWFLKWADKKGYNPTKAYMFFKPKLKNTPKKVIFLTWEELTKLKEYKIPETKQYLERVRDVFLACCYTGLRYSDAYNLKRSDVKAEHIEITTVKTSDSLIIELNNYSKAILNKYKDIPFENDKALPVISNQKMNEYLKELAELAEINEPTRETYYRGNERIDIVTPKYSLLGTHAGRRTFICNALSLEIRPEVIMKWTGHSDFKSMKPYMDVADKIKATAMTKFNQL